MAQDDALGYLLLKNVEIEKENKEKRKARALTRFL
jgi:hypothetical protein